MQFALSLATDSKTATEHQGMEEWRYSSTHSYLGTRWRWVVSFTPRPLYPQGKSPRYALDRRLGGPQNRSGYGGEKKNSQPLPGLDPPTFLQLLIRR